MDKSKLRQQFTELVEERLNMLHITQAVLAQRLNVKPSTLSKWINGQTPVSLQTIERIFEGCRCVPELDYKLIPRSQPCVDVFDPSFTTNPSSSPASSTNAPNAG